MRPPSFRRRLFARDGVFDRGGASASRMTTPHMLPSTSLNVSAPAMFCISQLNIPPHAIVVYASRPPSPAGHATLTTGRPLRPTRTGLAPARQRQLPGAPAKQSRRDAPRPLDGLPSPAARRASLAVALAIVARAGGCGRRSAIRSGGTKPEFPLSGLHSVRGGDSPPSARVVLANDFGRFGASTRRRTPLPDPFRECKNGW
jgi:hypothetical protein